MSAKRSPTPQPKPWRVYAYPLFTGQLEALTAEVGALREKDLVEYVKKRPTLVLAAINKLAFTVIPQDPTLDVYRQGKTLGDDYKHWFRAKFYQQYRLFFRYHAGDRIIVLAWVNDDKTLRAYESKNDAYKVFAKMLANGDPPDDWNELKAASKPLEEGGPE